MKRSGSSPLELLKDRGFRFSIGFIASFVFHTACVVGSRLHKPCRLPEECDASASPVLNYEQGVLAGEQ